MGMTEKVLWKVYAGVLGAASTLIAQKVVTKVWEMSTGDEPPDPYDPDTPLVKALIWATASGLGVGVTQLVMNRFMQQRWVSSMGHKAPSMQNDKQGIFKK